MNIQLHKRKKKDINLCAILRRVTNGNKYELTRAFLKARPTYELPMGNTSHNKNTVDFPHLKTKMHTQKHTEIQLCRFYKARNRKRDSERNNFNQKRRKRKGRRKIHDKLIICTMFHVRLSGLR